MFELSVACKYLRPRWRQLSVSIISLISILVIALVVWLIVVFFSVTSGLEKRWVDKLVALTSPIRITPTEQYYNSYYYQVDGISEDSNYSLKSIAEKQQSTKTDPYNPEIDEEVPLSWLKPDLDANGSLKDPVKTAFTIIENQKGFDGLKARPYEATAANLRLRLLRLTNEAKPQLTQAFISQTVLLGSLDNENPGLLKAKIPLTAGDAGNLLQVLSRNTENDQEDQPGSIVALSKAELSKRLKAYFENINISSLKTPAYGWTVPGALQIDPSKPLRLESQIELNAQLVADSLSNIRHVSRVLFDVNLDSPPFLKGRIPLGRLEVAKADIKTDFSSDPTTQPYWFYNVKVPQSEPKVYLPNDTSMGEGILLPRTFKEAGVLLGDKGYISFQIPTASTMQEQRVKVFVAGFYDQGLISIGGKFVIVNEALTNLIGSLGHNSQTQSNGINVRLHNLNQADDLKNKLQAAFNEAGIAPYWKIDTFREFEFTKDILQQLSSDKHLFTLLASVIIIVACSNIISMLIILVNDKKLEIGILRSMGASSASIAAIFGICGTVMGLMGSVIGIAAALLTLENLDVIVHLLSKLQGHQAFNPIYYGDSLPNEISFEVLVSVMTATVAVSLISGLVPAIKASLLRPSTILRAE